MKIPGVAGGRRVQTVVAAVDLLPTLLELSGVPVPPALDGRSVVPEIFDDSASRLAFSQKTKKGKRLFSIRTPRYHLFWDGKRDAYHFFDLSSDAAEVRNLSPSGTETEADLRARLSEWVSAHDRTRQRSPLAGKLPVDAEVEEELRALGYVQ